MRLYFFVRWPFVYSVVSSVNKCLPRDGDPSLVEFSRRRIGPSTRTTHALDVDCAFAAAADNDDDDDDVACKCQ